MRADRKCWNVAGARGRSPLLEAAAGQLTFRATSAAIAVYPPGATWGPRTLRSFEFVWMIDGEAVWDCNGTQHVAPPGTMILSQPGTREHYRWDKERQTRHAFVHFSIASGLELLPPPATWPIIRELPEGDILRPLFRHLLWAFHHAGSEREVAVQVALRHMLLSFLGGAVESASTAGTELPRAVDLALRWINGLWERKPSANPGVAELARAAGVSPRQLHRAFQQEFKCAPMTALRLIRLDRGAFMLSATTLDIQEIAGKVGFSNQFHFSRAFKAAFGRAPSEFRARLAKGQDAPPTAILRLRATTRQLLGPTG